MSFYLLAIWMGFLGSWHCGLMCGPLVLSLPVAGEKPKSQIWPHVQYQIARILTYGLFGLIVGGLGQVIGDFTGHGQISLTLGILLIAMALLYFFSSPFRQLSSTVNLSNSKLFKFFGRYYGSSVWPFMAGIMNGLLPCGMVYLALATALNANYAVESAIFMMLFGLGTLPLLMAVALGGVYLKKYISFDARKMIPYFALFIGLLLVFRSLHLGIPFISPADHLGYGSSTLCR